MAVADYLRVIDASTTDGSTTDEGDESDNADATVTKAVQAAHKNVHRFKFVGGYYDRSLHEKHYFCASEIVQFFICESCKGLLDEPVMLPKCGHKLCRGCAEDDDKATSSCPKCHERFYKNKILSIVGYDQVMKNMTRWCVNALGYDKQRRKVVQDPESCGFKGYGQCLNTHESTCGFEVVTCTLGCDTQLWKKDIGAHADVCSYRCSNYSCWKTVLVKNKEYHIKEECPATVIECPMTSEGCTETHKRQDMQEHIDGCPFMKVKDKLSELSEAKAEIERLKRLLETSTPTKVEEQPIMKRLRSGVTKREPM